MEQKDNREAAYLIEVIRCAVNGRTPAPPKDTLDWETLIALAKKHEVYSAVAGVLPREYLTAQAAEMLNNYSKSELVRIIAMNGELAVLEQELSENSVNFMLLKGSRLKALYPKESMRQMSDVDILYDISGREAVLKIMKNHGYRHYAWSDNSDDFHKEPVYTFEFHRELFFNEHGFYPDFSFVWENAKEDETLPHRYLMSENDLYLHSIAHMYKHKLLGGMGIRFLCDTYLMLKKYRLDFVYINAKLDAMGILDFGDFIKVLSLHLFDAQPLQKKEQEFLAQVMDFGLFGDGTQGKWLLYESFREEHNSSSMLRYSLSRMFPEREFMQRTYPVLVDKPHLLPFYYGRRLADKWLHNREKAMNEIKTIKRIKDDEEH